MIVDTNVLVAAFHKSEPNHDDARYFLDEFDYQWLVRAAVVIETWGFIVGSQRLHGELRISGLA